MNTSLPRVSGADIAVPSPPPPAPTAAAPLDIKAVLHDVWRMLVECGSSNQNDRLTVAVEALIEAGVDTRQRIVGAARCLGFKPSHVGAVLGRGREWRLGVDGRYRLVAALPA